MCHRTKLYYTDEQNDITIHLVGMTVAAGTTESPIPTLQITLYNSTGNDQTVTIFDSPVAAANRDGILVGSEASVEWEILLTDDEFVALQRSTIHWKTKINSHRVNGDQYQHPLNLQCREHFLEQCEHHCMDWYPDDIGRLVR